MPGGFFIYHADGNERLVYANQALIHIYGCESPEEFREYTGYTFSGLGHPEDIDAVRQSIRQQIHACDDDLDYVEYRIIRKDGEVRWIEDYGRFVHTDSYGDLFYVFVGDATEKHLKAMDDQRIAKLAQERLEALDALEHEATALKLVHEILHSGMWTMEFDRQASQAKTMFLNNMSHDIRTPMNAIIGFTNLAITHLDNPELVRDYLNKITASCSHLLSLINDVLDMSRIESGKVVIQETPCSLSQILQDIRSMLQTDLETKKLSLHLDDSGLIHPSVSCDHLRLNQILLNLLSNALKFTPANGHISIFVTESPGSLENTAIYKFRIQDTGIGMAPEFLEHIFEPFERERTSTVSGIQGTGLGMSITKNLVELMNGQISIESRQGYGSTFYLTFTFHLSEPPVEQGIQEVVSVRQPTGWHLLLVEDNELNQEIAVTILEDAGYTVDVASDGTEAVEKVRCSLDAPCNLILMDIQMPIMDGIEATKIIRSMEEPRLAGLPIVAMTANAFEEDRQRVLSAGMNGHLGKPIDTDKLFATLQSILSDAST